MSTNIVLNDADKVVIAIIIVVMLVACRIIYGFFHEGKEENK